MAGTGVWIRLLDRHRARLMKDPDMNRVMNKLIKRRFFSNNEERHLASISDASERIDILLDKFSTDPGAFREFCMTLEECAPHLLTELLLDRGAIFTRDEYEENRQALQVGFELALKERDSAVRDQVRTAEDLAEARLQLGILQAERDRAVSSLENLSSHLDKPANPKRFEGGSSGSSLHQKTQDRGSPHLVEESGTNVLWQIHRVTLQRVANYGFGIAVSGGHDSPHFASGDPSIAISDVLKAGPAEGKLQLNDRIISANGISLENVSHATAIQVLKNSGDSVHLVVRRRVVMPAAMAKESPPLKVTLIKKSKKDEFGLVLSCRFFIQEVIPGSLAAHDGGVKSGDTVLKINNTPLDGLSVGEVKKLIEKSKDRLQLIVSKSLQVEERSHPLPNQSRDDEGYATFRPPHDKEDVNLYRPSVQSDDLYHGDPPPGPYPLSNHAHFDGRYVYDHEAPPRPPVPGTFPSSLQRNEDFNNPDRDHLRADDFYAPALPRDANINGYRKHPDDDVFVRPSDERYVGLRSGVRAEMRQVVFHKDQQKGLGLRLAGGNATGIFIASVQPGSAAEAEGLIEGDQILQANGLDIVGLTREEAVGHLTGLQGKVTLVVQYKKEDYDSIMASHEAGDSFYIRTHFNYHPAADSGDHAFIVGDIFHIKDTLFRGVGGSWLAICVGPSGEDLKKGTIPNKKKAEVLASVQQEDGVARELFPNKGRGSLFKRKSARRAKSLGKDHWEEVIFSGLATKFPPYERVILRDPAFVRPVVLFGAIADIAREKLLSDFPDKFESLQADKGEESDPKRSKTGIIRFGAIQETMKRQKHCVLDVTPYHLDRLNYAQYYPIVVFLRGENKQAIKEVRSRWRGSGSSTTKNPKKLQEHNERMENLYSHLFTGVITHSTTDVWFPKLVELIQSQQRRPVWMSEKKPEEDFNDDLMFPMPNRLSLTGSPETDHELQRSSDDLDIVRKQKRLVRSSSDPSVNTTDRVPGIPPYPAPPGYSRDIQTLPHDNRRGQWDDYRQPVSVGDRDGGWQVPPDDRYYPHPHHPPEPWPEASSLPRQNVHPPAVDDYVTILPHERNRKKLPDSSYPGGFVGDTSPKRDRLPAEDRYRTAGPRPSQLEMRMHPSQSQSGASEHKGYNDTSSNDNDSYSHYVSSPANKHDDSKLRDKFGALQVGPGQERSAGSHDPYRFTRSTAIPVSNANIDRAKLSHLTARYRKEDGQAKPRAGKMGGPTSPNDSGTTSQKKKEPPPVPAKTYSLKEVGMDLEDIKARNYENSNRSYNYSDTHYPGHQKQLPGGDVDRPYQHNPNISSPSSAPTTTASDSPYEYIAARSTNLRPSRPGRTENVPPDVPPPPQNDYIYSTSHASRAFANSTYMDHQDVERARSRPSEADPESVRFNQARYTRPRTDDEQLQELQVQRQYQTHAMWEPPLNGRSSKVVPLLNDRTKLETHSDSRSVTHWNKYKSWDNEKESQKAFDSYKKLITPGFYGSRKMMSKSHDELREENGLYAVTRPSKGLSTDGAGRGSAFESYRKMTSSLGLSPGDRNRLQPSADKTLKQQTKGSDPPKPPPLPSLSSFTEMSAISSNKLLPPPPLYPPLAAIMTTFPVFQAKLNSRPEVAVCQPLKRTDEGHNLTIPKNFGSSFKQSLADKSESKYALEGSSRREPVRKHLSDCGLSEKTPLAVNSAGQKRIFSSFSGLEKLRHIQNFQANSFARNPYPAEHLDHRAFTTSSDEHLDHRAFLTSPDENLDHRAFMTSPDEILPPPPPAFLASESQESKSSPPRPPLPKAMLTFVMPPESSLPLVNGTGDKMLAGNFLFTTASGTTSSLKKEEDINGEGSEGGETSDSVSTPDTVISRGISEEMEDNQTVVATARGVFTSAGGILESKETGVSIVIPEGALAPGSSQEIYFKVCSGSSILPPLDTDKGETLLSPLVMCGPHGLRFNKPVELRLPHSASLNPDSWSFALKSSDSPSGHPTEWQNMNLAGSEGVAQGQVNQNSVSVLVDHF